MTAGPLKGPIFACLFLSFHSVAQIARVPQHKNTAHAKTRRQMRIVAPDVIWRNQQRHGSGTERTRRYRGLRMIPHPLEPMLKIPLLRTKRTSTSNDTFSERSRRQGLNAAILRHRHDPFQPQQDSQALAKQSRELVASYIRPAVGFGDKLDEPSCLKNKRILVSSRWIDGHSHTSPEILRAANFTALTNQHELDQQQHHMPRHFAQVKRKNDDSFSTLALREQALYKCLNVRSSRLQ